MPTTVFISDSTLKLPAGVRIYNIAGLLTILDRLELVVAAEVGEPPQAAVDNVRQTLLLGHLRIDICN